MLSLSAFFRTFVADIIITRWARNYFLTFLYLFVAQVTLNSFVLLCLRVFPELRLAFGAEKDGWHTNDSLHLHHLLRLLLHLLLLIHLWRPALWGHDEPLVLLRLYVHLLVLLRSWVGRLAHDLSLVTGICMVDNEALSDLRPHRHSRIVNLEAIVVVTFTRTRAFYILLS